MKKVIEKIKNNPYQFMFYTLAIVLIIIFFSSIIITQGDSIKHYLFTDKYDTFMDFFNSMRDTIGRRPYDKGVIYPPLCYTVYYILLRMIPIEQLSLEKLEFKSLQGPMLVFCLYEFITIGTFIFLTLRMKKGNNKEKSLFLILILLSLPFMFAFERGNIVFLALVLLMTFICFKDSENKILKEIALISLAASAAIKIYPAIFGLILLKEKKYKEIIRVIIYGLVLFICPFILFGGLETIKLFIYNLTGATNEFNTSFIINRLNFNAALGEIFEYIKFENYDIISKIIIVIIFILSCINSFITKDKWKLYTLLTCLLIGIPGISYTYTAIFFVIPVLSFLNDAYIKKEINYVYLLLFILILYPFPMSLLEGGSFDYFYSNVSLNTKVMSLSILLLTIILNIDIIFEKIKELFNKSGKKINIATLKNNKSKKIVDNRIKYIDVAKGIALFFVVLGHLVKFDSPVFNWIFSFHMPLFFVLSGMSCNLEKYNNFFEYFKRKVKTIIVPYFIFSLVGFIICLFVPSWRINLFTFDTLKQLLYYTQPELLHVGQVWFLIALFFSSIFFYIIERIIFKKTNKFVKPIFYIVTLVIGYVIYKQINIPYFGRLPWKIDVAITGTVFMAIGYYIQKFKIFEKIFDLKCSFATFIILLLINILFGTILNGYVNICNCDYGNLFYYYISSVSGCMSICILAHILEKSRILKYYGQNSLPIFAIHSMFLYLTEVILSLIFNTKYYIMQNIPLHLCIICAFIIYVCLYPIPKIYNYIKNGFKKINI